MEAPEPNLEAPTPGISSAVDSNNGIAVATASPIRRGQKPGDQEAKVFRKSAKFLVIVLVITAVVVGLVKGTKNREDDTKTWEEDDTLNGGRCGSVVNAVFESCYQHYEFTKYADLDLRDPLQLTAPTECHCLEMCFNRGKHFARFEVKRGWRPNEHSCQCSSSISGGLVPYGEGVGALPENDGFRGSAEYPTVPIGSIMTGACSPEVHPYDYCEIPLRNSDWETVGDHDALCLTGHELEIHMAGWPWMLENALLPEPANSSFIDSQYECLEYCASYPLVAHYQEYRDTSPYTCSCFDEDVTCYIPWGERHHPRVFSPPHGTLHSKSEFGKCDVDFEWCDVFPGDMQCFNGTAHEVKYEGWPWQSTSGASYWNPPASQTNATSAHSCVQHCLPENQVAVYLDQTYDNGLDFSSNCLCYNDNEGAMCLMPWGDQVDSSNAGYVPRGTAYTRDESLMEVCPNQQTWCDVNPNHWLCFTRNHSSVSSTGWPWQPQTTNHLQPASEKNVSSLPECIQHCISHGLAVVLDSPSGGTTSNANCLCYDEQATCVLPWGDVDSHLIPRDTIVFMSGDSLPSCSDYSWCDAVPDHWLCLTRNSVDLHKAGWPRQLEENDYLQTADQTNAVSEEVCIQHCQPYHVAVFINDPSSNLFLDVNCLCYDEQASCLVPWGDQVSKDVRPFGTIHSMTGSPMSTCTDVSWCDLNPDHWYCFTAMHLSVDVTGWPWQSNTDGFLPAAAQSDSISRESCLDFCMPYPVTVHLNNTDGNWADILDGDLEGNCLCFDEQATCIMWWDWNAVGSGAIPRGDLFAKKSAALVDPFGDHGESYGVNECRPPFCEVLPDHQLCGAYRRVRKSDEIS